MQRPTASDIYFFHTYRILMPLPSWETAFGRRKI